jgi:hypothetical protein
VKYRTGEYRLFRTSAAASRRNIHLLEGSRCSGECISSVSILQLPFSRQDNLRDLPRELITAHKVRLAHAQHVTEIREVEMFH